MRSENGDSRLEQRTSCGRRGLTHQVKCARCVQHESMGLAHKLGGIEGGSSTDLPACEEGLEQSSLLVRSSLLERACVSACVRACVHVCVCVRACLNFIRLALCACEFVLVCVRDGTCPRAPAARLRAHTRAHIDARVHAC
eukprot:4395000-Pleurochrysis_carterae.AAC.1